MKPKLLELELRTKKISEHWPIKKEMEMKKMQSKIMKLMKLFSKPQLNTPLTKKYYDLEV